MAAFLAAVDLAYLPDNAALALETLRALSGAGRFSILAMCLDKRDAQSVSSIFTKLEGARAQGSLDATPDMLKKLCSLYS